MKIRKRIVKKILITFLCTVLCFSSIFNCKIKAQATTVVAGLGAASIYELCLYIGGLVAVSLGIGYTYENRDTIAQLGKDFIDSTDTSEINDWLFGTSSTLASYVYGSEALEEIQDMSWEVIEGGGNAPKNDDDNDGDGDKDEDDRTWELEHIGMWATAKGFDFIEDNVRPLLQSWQNGDDSIFLANYYGFDSNDYKFDGNYTLNENGSIKFRVNTFWSSNGVNYKECCSFDSLGALARPCCVKEGNILYFYAHGSTFAPLVARYNITSGNETLENSWTDVTGVWYSGGLNANVPVFDNLTKAQNYMNTGSLDGVLNLESSQIYRIADWLQEDWAGHLDDLATSLRSLQDISAIAQALAAGALASQPDANAWGDMLNNLLSQYPALTNPVTNPEYYPSDSTVPHIDPSDLPNPQTNPTPGVTPIPTPTPGPEDPEDGESTDTFGLNTLFGILILLILILLMLLAIFLSCLAFIIMIFRIPATTGFLPPDMISGLNYIKTLQIPGFGMSVYTFFMSLIYIILLFSVIGILRKNIDKIHFPRKRGGG